MNPIRTRCRAPLFLFALSGAATLALAGDERKKDLVADLAGSDEQARAAARQLLPRQGIEILPRILPLLGDETTAVKEAAYQVLLDLANEASAPGRVADRAKAAAEVMGLLGADRPKYLKLRGLRLAAIVLPDSCDVGPIAALLDDPELREYAREALEEANTAPGRLALRGRLGKSDPDFTCAILDSLGRMRDRDGLAKISEMTSSDDPRVRAAASRALAWAGDPASLANCREVVAKADAATKADAWDAELRLLNKMALREDSRPAARAGYRELIAASHGQVKDGALAGLGRIGTVADIPAIASAIRHEDAPTLNVGASAMGCIPGREASQGLARIYGGLPDRVKLALLPVMGARPDDCALPLIAEVARGGDAAFRAMALRALGASSEPKALEMLRAEAERGDAADRTLAKDVLAAAEARLNRERLARLGSGYGHETDLLALHGVIGRWHVVGPFDLGEKNEGWARDYISEPDVNVVARYMAGKVRRQWKPLTTQDPHGKIDLRANLADRDKCIGYAYAEIEVDRPTDAVLLLGVDDGEKVWVNGKKVFELFEARGLTVDQDKIPIRLIAGTNKILLKIYQNTLGWEFCARVATPDGQPIPIRQRAD
ncbi:HEAT repeat protein [Aquisphaera giovannonii]|uniref:HEAT repeat protein n=1 Tax=Aquisphaera giovannonii TaxID=406548 RepID=A0A5B9W0U8_9BACT|nr:HEAT repeat domain-containing protein [Aquisphaera giovannonii]QEH33585.1 HEAT repeat protein [Aquisphaera giovannonii]